MELVREFPFIDFTFLICFPFFRCNTCSLQFRFFRLSIQQFWLGLLKDAVFRAAR